MNKRILICACDEKGGIAKEGKIPWDFPEDRKFFKRKLRRFRTSYMVGYINPLPKD